MNSVVIFKTNPISLKMLKQQKRQSKPVSASIFPLYFFFLCFFFMIFSISLNIFTNCNIHSFIHSFHICMGFYFESKKRHLQFFLRLAFLWLGMGAQIHVFLVDLFCFFCKMWIISNGFFLSRERFASKRTWISIVMLDIVGILIICQLHTNVTRAHYE